MNAFKVQLVEFETRETRWFRHCCWLSLISNLYPFFRIQVKKCTLIGYCTYAYWIFIVHRIKIYRRLAQEHNVSHAFLHGACCSAHPIENHNHMTSLKILDSYKTSEQL